jgi:tetratricopeptide (TPR) repeat protein
VIFSLVLIAAAAAPDPCPLPDAAPAPDRIASRAYLEVGDAERSAGSAETAAAAYRAALRLDPSSARARESFVSSCMATARTVAIRRGRQLMDAGDRQAAIAVFERIRASSPDPTTALLEGICHYEEADDELARPLLEEARSAPELADSATYFLALLDLRDGEARSAAARFEQVTAARQTNLAERASVLLNAARRSGRAVLSVFAESGYDSNVNLTPPDLPADEDAGAGGGAAIALRPLGLSGPYLRATGFYRRQIQHQERDLGDLVGTAGWRIGRGESHVFADYTYAVSLLGGATYLSAHRPRAGFRWRVGRLALAAILAARVGTYRTASVSRYSGVLQTVDPEISYRFPLGSAISLGYHGGRDSTEFADTTSFEHGPRLSAIAVLGSTWRVLGEVSYLHRTYNAPAAGDLQPRMDDFLYAGASVEKDLGERWTLRISAADRIASSNLPRYSYSRIMALLGLTYTVGLF